MQEMILSHGAIAALFCTDQILKRKARELNAGETKSLPLGLRFKKSFNRGAAMNLGQRHPEYIRLLSGLVLTGAEAALLIKLAGKKHSLTNAGLTLMIGGAASNVYDRFKRGEVTDYISFTTGIPRLDDTVFNLGDFAIFAGTLLIGAGA